MAIIPQIVSRLDPREDIARDDEVDVTFGQLKLQGIGGLGVLAGDLTGKVVQPWGEVAERLGVMDEQVDVLADPMDSPEHQHGARTEAEHEIAVAEFFEAIDDGQHRPHQALAGRLIGDMRLPRQGRSQGRGRLRSHAVTKAGA